MTTTPTTTELALAQIAQGLNAAAEQERGLPPIEDESHETRATLLVGLARLEALAAGVLRQLAERREFVTFQLARRLDRDNIDTVRTAAGVANLAEMFTVTPTIADLLPEGVKADDSRYASTVANAEAAATARLITAMESLPAYSELVSKTYDHAALAEELCGDDAPRNEGGVPKVPDALAPFVTVTRELDIVLTDPSGNTIGGES